MKIELKNGEILNLEVTPLFLEYLDDYDGGFEKLLTDWKNKYNQLYIINFFTYAAIASNYDKPLDYRSSLKLVRLEDIEKIANFVAENIPDIEKNINVNKRKHF